MRAAAARRTVDVSELERAYSGDDPVRRDYFGSDFITPATRQAYEKAGQ
jgi:hypothetical protein